MECHDCKNGMLDLAYGLLEPAEAEGVRAHAASCPACSAEHAEAAKVKVLLGRAAKFTFDDVVFDAPLNEVAMPKRKWKRAVLTWTVAAAALIGVIAIPPYLNSNSDPREDQAKLDTSKDKDKDDGKKPGIVVDSDIRESAPGEWSAQSAQFRVTVLGPKSAKAGSEFSITAADASGKPLRVRVTVLVMTGNTPIVNSKKSFETDAKWTLASDLFEKLPARDAMLQVHATHITSGDRVTVNVPLR